MLRSNTATLLVCLLVCLVGLLCRPARAADPDESLEILLKPNSSSDGSVSSSSRSSTGYARANASRSTPTYASAFPSYGPKQRIAKVKPIRRGVFGYARPPVLAQPAPKQWEFSTQVIFARTKGKIAWPRNPYGSYGYWGWGDDYWTADLNNDLQVPEHDTWVEITLKYQFRPHWSFRYSVLTEELNGGGWPTRQFWFGNRQINWGENINTKWEHSYHRVGLVYDAIRTCVNRVSVFADWVHTEDKIQANCSYCGNYQSIFSKGGDMAMVGIEMERMIRATCNGGAWSTEHHVGFMFLDDAEGWDLETGLKYSVALGCRRQGYLKGGYRYVNIKKGQPDLLFENTLEGGFLEFGLVF